MNVTWLLLAAVTFFLAFSNGANDNFKGVATLLSSRTASFSTCLAWATVSTLAGSVTSLWLAQTLVKAFTGKGLVPEGLAAQPEFLLAVAAGSGLTVMLATLCGLPVSTTHALVGGLMGAGLAWGEGIQLGRLSQAFLAPLAVSPLISLLLAGGVYPLFRKLRVALGVERRMCLCRDDGAPLWVQAVPDGSLTYLATGVQLTAGEAGKCRQRYLSPVAGIDVQRVLDGLHFLSAGIVSYARGLNDTPKIVALLVGAQGLGFSNTVSLAVVGGAMAAGGLMAARKVAATMSFRITAMNHGQGFTANLVTAVLLLFASRLGMPVSTTHVSCGSLFGLGAVTGKGRWDMIGTILAAWVFTLPAAALLAAIAGWLQS